jgi:cytochrome c peroxidase
VKFASIVIFCVLFVVLFTTCQNEAKNYTCEEVKKLILNKSTNNSLSDFLLPSEDEWNKIPQDSLNPITSIKVTLGKFLFFDPAISFDPKCKEAAQTFSCASCHFADAGFSAGIRQAIAGGGRGFGFLRHKHPFCGDSTVDVQQIKTPSIVNCAYQELMLWSGKFGSKGINKGTDSLWPKGSFLELNGLGLSGVETQARVALEAHGMRLNPKLLTTTEYHGMFDSSYTNERDDLRYRRFTMARAIAAYERTVISNKAPFQLFLRGNDSIMSQSQLNGAAIFFDKGKCVNCHNGPALNSMAFYALGMPDMLGQDVLKSDSSNDAHLGRAAYSKRDEDKFKFKVPQLYNLKNHNFYGHGANFCSVEEVIRYKNQAIPSKKEAIANISADFVPLKLTETEIKQLTDFIENALFDPDLKRYEPNHVPSGFCFPNNDKLSRIQLHCTK